MARSAPARSRPAVRPAPARSRPPAVRPAPVRSRPAPPRPPAARPAPARSRPPAARPAPARSRPPAARVAAAAPASIPKSPTPKPKPAKLKAVPKARPRRSVGSFATFAALVLFLALLGLAGLHAVLVQNQAELDDLVSANRARGERVDELLGRIAILDSPAGVADQAVRAGLVLAPEVVTLSPVAAGVLGPSGPDPFGLIRAGLWTRPQKE